MCIRDSLNEIDERFDNIKEQVIESISNNCEKMINEMNKNLDRKLNQIMNKKLSDNVTVMTNNNNDKIMGVENSDKSDKFDENKDDQMTYNEVSRGENYDEIIKNSGDKILEEVECNNGMLVCVDAVSYTHLKNNKIWSCNHDHLGK